MHVTWTDEFLTVNQIAERLQLNQQTIRNWIDEGRLPAVRVGRRVRVRTVDLDRLLASGATSPIEEALEEEVGSDLLVQALRDLQDAQKKARRLLDRRSAARRAELATELQDLSVACETVLEQLSDG